MPEISQVSIMLKDNAEISGDFNNEQLQRLEHCFIHYEKGRARFEDQEGYFWLDCTQIVAILVNPHKGNDSIGFKGGE